MLHYHAGPVPPQQKIFADLASIGKANCDRSTSLFSWEGESISEDFRTGLLLLGWLLNSVVVESIVYPHLLRGSVYMIPVVSGYAHDARVLY